MVQKSDYQLIIEYKETNSPDVLLALYEKYMPLISKYSWNYQVLDSYEDRIQEAFFIISKVMDYTNINMINPNYSCRNFIELKTKGYWGREYTSKLNRVKKMEVLYNLNYESPYHSYQPNFVDDVNFKIMLEDFKKALNEKESMILRMLKEGMSKTQIAEEMKISKSTLTYNLKKLGEKYLSHMA